MTQATGGKLYAGDAPAHINALADGGPVTMPMQPAFWAKRWGMRADRYGCPWIDNGEEIPLA